MTLLSLPVGLTARPPVLDDAEQAAQVVRADEQLATGHPVTTAADLRSDWRRPSVDLRSDVVLVFDGQRLVGYADQSDGRAWVGVHPDVHGRGIGSWLLGWTEAQARRHGLPRVGQTVADTHTSAIALLQARGYLPRWESWVFTIDLHPHLPVIRLPEGMVVRPMARPEEDTAVHRVIEDAFSEWPDRDRGRTFEDWRAAHLDRDDVEVLVVDDGGHVVGVAVCLDEGEGEGWVEQLAVAASHRGRGLGRALLHAAFRAFHERGCTTAGLSTDSRTGAKALYEHVGMTVTDTYRRWSKDLG